MRPITVRLTAAGFSNWIVLDRYVRGFVVGLSVKLSSNGNLTYSVQHTFDDILQDEQPPTPITRVTTTASVTKVNHGLSVADYVGVKGADAPFDTSGAAVAAITSQDVFTYAVSNSGATASAPFYRLVTARIYEHEELTGLTASADGNYAAPPVACRLIISSFTAGYADFTVIQAGK